MESDGRTEGCSDSTGNRRRRNRGRSRSRRLELLSVNPGEGETQGSRRSETHFSRNYANVNFAQLTFNSTARTFSRSVLSSMTLPSRSTPGPIDGRCALLSWPCNSKVMSSLRWMKYSLGAILEGPAADERCSVRSVDFGNDEYVGGKCPGEYIGGPGS